MSTPGYGNLPVVIDPTAWAGRAFSPALSLTIDAIQNQVAAQLTAFFASGNLDIPIYVWPDFDLDEWWKGTAIAFVLISYSGTNLSKPQSTSAMLQERTVQFKVHVEARQVSWALAGSGSVYALIDAIEAALTGFQPNGCRNAYFTEERYEHEVNDGGVWKYDMLLNVVTMRPKLLPQYALANLIEMLANVQPSGDQIVIEAGQGEPENE